MVHPLVEQLRFARSEFRRGLEGVSEPDAMRRFLPMNCISWNVGHLAWQEQRYWLERAQGRMLMPDINTTFAFGADASTPLLSDMWRARGYCANKRQRCHRELHRHSQSAGHYG